MKNIAPNHKKLWPRLIAWNRKMHLWVGLWGALLGLIFGVSGIWLNHRAVLKLPPVYQARGTTHIALPESATTSPANLAAWIQSELNLSNSPNNTRIERSRPVPWTSGTKQENGSSKDGSTEIPRQPERWTLNYGGPDRLIQAEYWVGNKTVSLTSTANGTMAILMNLHKGTGMTAPWILFIDTFAGSMIFLSLSGLLIWSSQSKRRMQGIGILSAALLVTGLITVTRLNL